MNDLLPFTADQFFAIFAAYNDGIWPAQAAAYGAGVAAVLLVLWRPDGRAPFWVLALMWAWTGIAYHVLYFAAINPAAYLFGALFAHLRRRRWCWSAPRTVPLFRERRVWTRCWAFHCAPIRCSSIR